MKLKKRSMNGQVKSPANSIIIRATRIKGKIQNLIRTPTIYELLRFGRLQKQKQQLEKSNQDYFGPRQGKPRKNRKEISNHLLKLVQMSSRRESGTKRQRRIESDFKWLERFRVFITFAQNIEQLEELSPQQLDLLRTKPLDEQSAQIVTEEMKKRQQDKQDLFAYLHTQGNALWDFINSLQNLNFFDNLELKMRKWATKDFERVEEALQSHSDQVRERIIEFRGEARYTSFLEIRNPGTLSPVHSEGQQNQEDLNSLLPKREHSFTLGRKAARPIPPKFEKEEQNALQEVRNRIDSNCNEKNVFTNFESLIEDD